MTTLAALLTKALQENQLVCSDDQQQKLVQYLELLQTWNRVFNLTTITQPRDMVYLHILDSLVVEPHLKGERFLDVGTGAGLPGIPLAILHPEQTWVLLDKNSKKTRFLTQAIAELQLPNVEAIQNRVEDFHPKRGFDSILSRAFGTLKLFVETTKHLLLPAGQLIAMKGKYPQDELQDIPSDFSVQEVSRLTIQGTDIERHLVRLSRNEST